MRGKKWTETDKNWLKMHFSDTKTSELARKMGVSVPRIERYAYNHGLHKSDQYLKDVRMMALNKARQANLTRDYDNTKNVESLRKRIKIERARIAFGLEQKTKMRLISQSKSRINLRYRLKKSGYIIDDEERIAYYDDYTHRLQRTEAHNQSWYVFKPAAVESV